MSAPFSMENVAAMAGLPQQGHNIVIESIDRFGVNTTLECVGHSSNGCDAQDWFKNGHISEVADLPDLNIRIPVTFITDETVGGRFTPNL